MFRLFGLLLVGLVLAGCQTSTSSEVFNTFAYQDDRTVCVSVRVNRDAQQEARRRGLSCGVGETLTTKTASSSTQTTSTNTPQPNTPTSAKTSIQLNSPSSDSQNTWLLEKNNNELNIRKT